MTLLLPACQRPAAAPPEMRVEHQLTPQPPRVGPATIMLTLAGADGRPLTGATVRLEGNMSHAGMKPVFAEARELQPGRYEALLEFTMGGDWFLIITAALPDGRTLERQVDVRGVQSR